MGTIVTWLMIDSTHTVGLCFRWETENRLSGLSNHMPELRFEDNNRCGTIALTKQVVPQIDTQIVTDFGRIVNHFK